MYSLKKKELWLTVKWSLGKISLEQPQMIQAWKLYVKEKNEL